MLMDRAAVKWCSMLVSCFTEGTYVVGFCAALLSVCLFSCHTQGQAYANELLDSLLEWSLYILTLCFVWPGRLGEQPNDWQWQCGALAVFLAWFNLVLFVQR